VNIFFDNPSGLFALLGVPALLAIHALQSRARRARASTLFLLERLAPESRGGRRLERLRSSLPLWLQLAAVLVLAWVLAAPRWVRDDSFRRVVVVLDSSLSMEASLDETRAALPPRLRALAASSSRTEWTLMESDVLAPVLYRGEDSAALAAALSKWRPALGAHDFSPALRLASSLARGGGAVVFVTDHAGEAPEGAATLSFARARDNAGFSGSSVEATPEGVAWRALVRNYSAAPRALEWKVSDEAGRETPPRALSLDPGETRVIGGVFPDGAARVAVALTPNGFALDDTLPLVRPRPKPMRFHALLSGPEREFAERALRGTPGLLAAARPEEADLLLVRRDPAAAAPPPAGLTKPAVVFPSENEAAEIPLEGWLLANKHELAAGTGWQGLICARAAGFAPRAEDVPLLWRGGTPLIWLRQEAPLPAPPSLFFNFLPSKSNAPRLPAFVVLLHRYAEMTRARLPAPFAANTGTNQSLPLVFDSALGGLSLRAAEGAAAADKEEAVPLPPARAAVFRAPPRAGFFQVSQGGRTLLDGAACFSDPREADLTQCAEADTLAPRERALARATSSPDPWRRLWLTLLLALPLAAWAAGRVRRESRFSS
jgi:hypothetical protein